MPDCPACNTMLRTVRQQEGICFVCDGCGGRAVTIPQIRRVTGDRFATNLLRQINGNQHFGKRPCPFCKMPMRQFRSQEPALELDACKFCGAVWFDASEFESIPENAVESVNELSLRGAEAIGRHRIEEMKRVDADFEGPPEEAWKMIPAMFGFPVERETDPLTRKPLVTWSLSALIALISLIAFANLREAVSQFGFVPAEAFRYGGITWLTSFFLHGGIMHLVGNLYFLLIFGDNVEDYLGRKRYGLLLLASTFVGDLVHFLVKPGSDIPAIGASGGISGVIVFYALQFPRARLSFVLRFFWWVHLPAWGALVLWLLMQAFGFFMQLSGFSNVAATAHLGGAVAGFALWWWWRRKELRIADRGLRID